VFPDLSGPDSTEWAVADFFAVAVHELRTPLTSIHGQAQLAKRFQAKDPQRTTDALDRILEQTKRMNRLIGDLLDQARVSVGALSLELVTFDLGIATAHTIGLLEHEDPPRITFPAPAPAPVRGDPDRIAQILGNLLDNAVKYSPPGSPIEVSLSVVGNEAQIWVTDRGVGVPDDERDRIFAPFYRASRTRDIAGTGLGLHISRRIAEEHHGRLWLESSSDAGSVFVLALPIAENGSAN
jgi:signal transduction histidine kinase